MENKEIREALEKQLQLLSKRSDEAHAPQDVAVLSHAMVELAELLRASGI